MSSKSLSLFDMVRNLHSRGLLDDYSRVPQPTSVPSPQSTLEGVRASVLKIKQALDEMRGGLSPLDKALTLRDLMQGGVLTIAAGNVFIGNGQGLNVAPGSTTAPPPTNPGDFFGLPTLTVPPTPTDLEAAGTFQAVIITWELTEYANHAYVEVWRASVDNLGSAVLVGTAAGNIYVDEASIALGVTYYYWVRAVGTAPATSPGAYNAVSGTPGGAGLIAGVDLGPLIIEAGHLADGSVTAEKIIAEIGGGNVVKNSSFEADSDSNGTPDHWAGTSIGTGITIVRSLPTTPVVHGSKALRMEVTVITPPTSVSAHQMYGADAADRFVVVEGMKYRVSCFVQTTTLTYAARFSLTWFDSGGAAISTTIHDHSFTGVGVFERAISDVMVAPAGAVAARPQLGILRPSVSDTTLGSVTFDAYQVESGELVTAYAPRPDEILPGTVGTTQIADDAITTEKIIAGAVVTSSIAAGAITATEIAASAITATKLAANAIAVGTAAIQNGAIVNAMIGNAAIDSAKIVDLAVATAKIADLAVTTAKIANLAVTNAKIANATIGSAQIANLAVGTAQIDDLAATTAKIANLAVTTAKIANLAVDTAQISDAAITNAKINDLSADKINAGAIRGINVNAASHTTVGSYVTSSVSSGATTINVKSTADFPSSGTGVFIDTSNDRDTFTYTGKTATTLTGVSGVAAHNSGATVFPLQKAMIIDQATNEMRFYGDRGDGTIMELASVGITTAGSDDWVIYVGGTPSGNSRAGVRADTYAATAIHGSAASNGRGVDGTSVSGVGVYGKSTSHVAGYFEALGAQAGVYAESASGYGAELRGNATKGPLYLTPLAGRPSNRTAGQLAVIYTTGGGFDNRNANPRLFIADGTDWLWVKDDSVFTG